MVNFRLMAAKNCGMISSPDCTGGVPETDLVQQRQKERHPARAEAGHEASDHRDPEGPRAKQGSIAARDGRPATHGASTPAAGPPPTPATPFISSTLSVCSPKTSRT